MKTSFKQVLAAGLPHGRGDRLDCSAGLFVGLVPVVVDRRMSEGLSSAVDPEGLTEKRFEKPL
jgi:hypothetical protein